MTAWWVCGLLLLTTPDRAESKPKLVVRDVEAKGASDAEAATLSSAVCSAFAKTRGFDVLCGEDLRAMLQFAAMAQSLDACAGESCLKGVRSALDARFVVSGTLKKSERGGGGGACPGPEQCELFVLTVRAFDGDQGEVVGRTEVEGPNLDRLQADAGEVAGALIQRLRRRAQSSRK
ncbi:MAG: hypothetical protein AAFZ18_09430 [Myxococcota bacterium]